MIFIFISVIISDAEYLFMCLLGICISLEKCVFRSSAFFSIRLLFFFFFRLLHYMNCSYILETAWLVALFASYFSWLVGCTCLWYPFLHKSLQV